MEEKRLKAKQYLAWFSSKSRYLNSYENEMIRTFLTKNNFLIDYRDENDFTAIRNVVTTNVNLDKLKLLIEYGANLNIQYPPYNQTILFCTIRNNNYTFFKTILDFGKNVLLDLRDNNGCTALICAVRNDRLPFVTLLLKRGADINVQDFLGNTILKYIFMNKDYMLYLKLFIEHNINLNIRNIYDKTILDFCLERNLERDIILHLIKNGADSNIHLPHDNNNTRIMYFIQNDMYEYLEVMLKYNKIDLSLQNNDGETAMNIACKYNRLDYIKILFEYIDYSNVYNVDLDHILLFAIFHGDVAFMIRLLQLGAKIHFTDKLFVYSFTSCIERNDIDFLKTLFDYGLNPNTKTNPLSALSNESTLIDFDTESILTLAVKYGAIDIIKFLVERGVDINVKVHNILMPLTTSSTVFTIAKNNNQIECYDFLAQLAEPNF